MATKGFPKIWKKKTRIRGQQKNLKFGPKDGGKVKNRRGGGRWGKSIPPQGKKTKLLSKGRQGEKSWRTGAKRKKKSGRNNKKWDRTLFNHPFENKNHLNTRKKEAGDFLKKKERHIGSTGWASVDDKRDKKKQGFPESYKTTTTSNVGRTRQRWAGFKTQIQGGGIKASLQKGERHRKKKEMDKKKKPKKRAGRFRIIEMSQSKIFREKGQRQKRRRGRALIVFEA